jgi:hydroxysqualene synthase
VIRRVVNISSRAIQPAPVVAPLPGPGGKLDVQACFRYCEALARARRHNFPVASIFLPSRLRPHVFALYAFARAADDFTDEPGFEGRRAEALDEWDDKLHRLYHGEVDHPIFAALAETVERFDLPITPLQDIIAAFRMDLRVTRYTTFNDLLAYARLAAAPIGRALLYVFGYRDAERHRFAEELSVALALTSLWQDLPGDLGRNRIYVPQEDLKHFGVAEADLFAHRETRALANLVRFQCARTRAIYERARPLIDLVDDDLGVEVAMFYYGGSRGLEKIEARAERVFAGRPYLNPADKAWVLSRAIARRGAGLLSRF